MMSRGGTLLLLLDLLLLELLLLELMLLELMLLELMLLEVMRRSDCKRGDGHGGRDCRHGDRQLMLLLLLLLLGMMIWLRSGCDDGSGRKSAYGRRNLLPLIVLDAGNRLSGR